MITLFTPASNGTMDSLFSNLFWNLNIFNVSCWPLHCKYKAYYADNVVQKHVYLIFYFSTSSLYFDRHILASLHFNENIHRETQLSKEGKEYTRVTYPKFKLGEVVREVACPPTYGKFLKPETTFFCAPQSHTTCNSVQLMMMMIKFTILKCFSLYTCKSPCLQHSGNCIGTFLLFRLHQHNEKLNAKISTKLNTGKIHCKGMWAT